MIRSRPLLFAVLLTGGLLLVACDSTGVNDDEDEPLSLTRVEDLPADPDTTSGPGRPQGYNQFAFFSLRDSSVVLHSDEANRADSASR